MTLEEAIDDCEEEISDCQIDLDGIMKLVEKYPERKTALAHDIDSLKKHKDYKRQLAAWLKELQERRKQPEIVHCGECRFNVSSHKCLHPESFFLVPDDDFYCGYAERRTDG